MPGIAERLITGLSSGTIDPAALGMSEQSALYRHCRTAVSRKKAQIADQVRIGRIRTAQKKQNELLRCLPARLLAAVAAIRKINKRRLDRPIGNHHPIPFRRVWSLAEQLRRDLAAPSYGIARLKPKRNHEFREVCMFELFDVARQKLVAISITPFVRLHHSQYGLNGGRSAACEALLEAMNNAPNGTKFMHVDITNFYGSIDHDWLGDNLPLSANIIQNVITLDNMRNILRWHLGLAHQHDEGTEEMDRQRIRKGIPQGSAVSPIVAEFVIANVLRSRADLFEGLSFFNYSDNLGILMPEDMDESAFMEHLRGVFRAHQAGPFQLRLLDVSDICSPFSFLGYHFEKTSSVARAFLPERVAFNREMNYERNLLEAETEEQVLRIEHAVRSYCASFSLWDGAAAMQTKLLEFRERELARVTRQTDQRLRARPVRDRAVSDMALGTYRQVP
jgi:RNA-directed DNA polymerase